MLITTEHLKGVRQESMKIKLPDAVLDGILTVPVSCRGIVLFVHGSGSGRLSPRNRFVADHLVKQGLGTLLFDLLTTKEEDEDRYSGEYRFNIPFLAERLMNVTTWFQGTEEAKHRSLGLFGASTGAAAALMEAARKPEWIKAVVCRGGRPDLALPFLPHVKSPTLLIIGGNDADVLALNCDAYHRMRAEKGIHVVPGAGHLFEEPGALEEVARVAAQWFRTYL